MITMRDALRVMMRAEFVLIRIASGDKAALEKAEEVAKDLAKVIRAAGHTPAGEGGVEGD